MIKYILIFHAGFYAALLACGLLVQILVYTIGILLGLAAAELVAILLNPYNDGTKVKHWHECIFGDLFKKPDHHPDIRMRQFVDMYGYEPKHKIDDILKAAHKASESVRKFGDAMQNAAREIERAFAVPIEMFEKQMMMRCESFKVQPVKLKNHDPEKTLDTMPHAFHGVADNKNFCICGLPKSHPLHTFTDTHENIEDDHG